MAALKETPLTQWHIAQGAKMTGFGGFNMPVSYESLINEHNWVRNKAGIFDVSHMGEFSIKSEGAFEFLQQITCNDISKLSDGQVQYNALIRDSGGVVDDITIYRISQDDYLLCVNAANIDKDFNFINDKHTEMKSPAELRNLSDEFGQIALQGPAAASILTEVLGELGHNDIKPSAIGYYRFVQTSDRFIVSRTGYTGEDGFEIYCPAAQTLKYWEAMAVRSNVKPIGLGARDTLRLEARYPLYGHELSDDWTIVEGGQGWIVKPKKPAGPFQDGLLKQKENGGPARKVTGFILLDPGVARSDYAVYNQSGKKIGFVTSGTFSPTLKKPIGLALLETPFEHGMPIEIEIRGQRKKATIQTKAFIETRAGKL